MENSKGLIVGAVAVVIIAIIAAVTLKPAVQVQVLPGQNGYNGSNGAQGPAGQNGQAGQSFGSLAGPDIPSPYLRWGGLGPIWNYSESPAATTTSGVFCAFLAPTGTSTLTLATWRPDALNGFGTGQTFDISTSSTISGSSTPQLIVAATFATAQLWLPEASTTGANPAQVLSAPSNLLGGSNVFTIVSSAASPVWLTYRVATSSAGNFASYPTGNCQAQFIQF